LFQHLYLLGRSATTIEQYNAIKSNGVSTPLPSGKVCDINGLPSRWRLNGSFNTFTFWEGLRLPKRLPARSTAQGFNTFTFWEGLRLHPAFNTLGELRLFQHLYLLGRSATSSTTTGIRIRPSSFNTFTFWEGLRPRLG